MAHWRVDTPDGETRCFDTEAEAVAALNRLKRVGNQAPAVVWECPDGAA